MPANLPANPPTIKAVCFDMDGLLFNTEVLFDEIGIEMLARRGKTLEPAVVQQMMGKQADIALQIFKDHYQLTDTVVELMQETDMMFDGLLPTRLEPMPGAIALLDHLSEQGTRPASLTTSSGANSVQRIMEICDLRRHFQFQLTAEDIANSKPHPEIYLSAAERFGVTPAELLVFEDSEHGCASGVAAGANVIAVPSKHDALHRFDGCLFMANSLEDERIQALLN